MTGRRSIAWMELPEEEILTSIRDKSLNPWELWAAVQQGKQNDALKLLLDAGWVELPASAGQWAVKIEAVPDDILGERFRIWLGRRG